MSFLKGVFTTVGVLAVAGAASTQIPTGEKIIINGGVVESVDTYLTGPDARHFIVYSEPRSLEIIAMYRGTTAGLVYNFTQKKVSNADGLRQIGTFADRGPEEIAHVARHGLAILKTRSNMEGTALTIADRIAYMQQSHEREAVIAEFAPEKN